MSARAIERGLDQVGTLGSGNHFLEIEVRRERVRREGGRRVRAQRRARSPSSSTPARAGSGYQVCDDSLEVMQRAAAKYGIALPDRQLACAPVESPEGGALPRRDGLRGELRVGEPPGHHGPRDARDREGARHGRREARLRLLYDVCHNIAKLERHEVGGAEKRLSASTGRARPARSPRVTPTFPSVYRAVGQPVLVPGDMGTDSYVCVGTEGAMKATFGSTCHGAGRMMSRAEGEEGLGTDGRLTDELSRMGVVVMAEGKDTLAEEMP